MRSSLCNAKEFYYIVPVILNEIGWFNVVCEGFFIVETHDAYTLILEFLFQMSTSRKKNVYALLTDEFMTQKILDFIGMKNNRIFYDRFHLKLNLENHQHVNGMFYKPHQNRTNIQKFTSPIKLFRSRSNICTYYNVTYVRDAIRTYPVW